MPIDTDAAKERVGNFCSKFFSLVIGICLIVCCLIYTIGVLHLIFSMQRFQRIEVAHFLGMGFAIASTVAYLILHFVPTKHYKLLHFLIGMLIFSLFFTGHSMGVTGPVVDDCDEDFQGAEENFENSLSNLTVRNIRRGNLGQSLGNCADDTVIFVGSLLLNVFQMIALFDVQRILLVRVKNTAYGERFVEIGIR